MNRKVKWALLALLGFSTACSTVRPSSSKGGETRDESSRSEDADTPSAQAGRERPRIVLMYGVRPPVSDSMRVKRLEQQRPDSLPPVAEQPVDETTSGE